MPIVLRQQLAKIVIGDRISFVTGDRVLSSWSVSLSDQDRSSQCSFEIFDPQLAIANLFLSQFQAHGGILTPEELLREVKVQNQTVTQEAIGIEGRPTGDDLARVIIRESIKHGVNQREQIAYILATAQHESVMGKLMVEQTSGKQYEGRRDLGNTSPGDGPKFIGRGYIQITGKNNYTGWAQKLKISLVEKPELATEPKYALPMLIIGMRDGLYTGKSLTDYIRPGSVDYARARRIVNGSDRAQLIAGYAKIWESRIDSLGYNLESRPKTVESATQILNRIARSSNSNNSKTEVELGAGVLIKVNIGFNDRNSVTHEYYLTGIKTSANNTTRFTGKQLRFLVGKGKRIFSVSQNLSVRQLARRLQIQTGIEIQILGSASRIRQAIQQDESTYQSLVNLAQGTGLFINGDSRTITIKPITASDRVHRIERHQLLSGSNWGDEATTNRLIKGSVKTSTNIAVTGTGATRTLNELASQSSGSERSGVLPIDSVIDKDEGVGRGFVGQLIIDSYRKPSILEALPNDMVELEASVGFGAALSRKYRISEVVHQPGQTTVEIYLPVAIKKNREVSSVATRQPGVPGDTKLSPQDQVSAKVGQFVAGFEVRSGYGKRVHPITKKESFHRGVDLAAPLGTPIFAFDKIKISRFFDTRGGGNVVRFDYGEWMFQVLHCQRVYPPGTYPKGSVIALVGSTGRSTGPHVHFEQLYLSDRKTRVDPYLGYLRGIMTGRLNKK
ncbi:MAG: peptidoglycan DD-metalloendopeptidase family protein [Moorea sp. SIO4A3]|nr:peptidoglycan DD-metalloendopeptidase family protein [Moorena sp. SIO4A3]